MSYFNIHLICICKNDVTCDDMFDGSIIHKYGWCSFHLL